MLGRWPIPLRRSGTCGDPIEHATVRTRLPASAGARRRTEKSRAAAARCRPGRPPRKRWDGGAVEYAYAADRGAESESRAHQQGFATVGSHHRDASAGREYPDHLVEQAKWLRHAMQRGKTAHHVAGAVVERQVERVAAHVDRTCAAVVADGTLALCKDGRIIVAHATIDLMAGKSGHADGAVVTFVGIGPM